ncbi:aminopeptidase M1-like protein isoform X1 [Tanacetum coccineum]
MIVPLTAGLRKAIEEKCLSPENKFGMLDDAYALCEAGEVSIMPLLSLMDLKLGLEAVSGESHLPTMVREEVFMALVNLDHKETHEELKKRFQTCLSIEEVRKIIMDKTKPVTMDSLMVIDEAVENFLSEVAPAEDGAAAMESTGDDVQEEMQAMLSSQHAGESGGESEMQHEIRLEQPNTPLQTPTTVEKQQK